MLYLKLSVKGAGAVRQNRFCFLYQQRVIQLKQAGLSSTCNTATEQSCLLVHFSFLKLIETYQRLKEESENRLNQASGIGQPVNIKLCQLPHKEGNAAYHFCFLNNMLVLLVLVLFDSVCPNH